MYSNLYLKSIQCNDSFGTPISLLVKRFSAARVLPLMMIGFVSCLSVRSCIVDKSDTRVQC